MRSTARLALLIFLLPGLACSREGSGASLHSDTSAGAIPALAAPAPYQPIELGQSGGIAGVAELDGPPPRPDTVFTVTSDTRVCGGAATDVAVRLDGGRLADVVVWLADARTGKALPLERRYEILNQRCQLHPRVQTAIAGGTLNVRSLDPAVHHLLFRDASSGDTLADVEENDAGQVVPLENLLAKPAMVRVSCALHPWTRGWIAVFDHPYFAVTAPDGSFAIDSIPPGTYRVMAWHERIGLVEDSVTVEADQRTEVNFRFGTR